MSNENFPKVVKKIGKSFLKKEVFFYFLSYIIKHIFGFYLKKIEFRITKYA